MPEHNGPTVGLPFPWRCHRCRKKAVRPVVIPYRTQIRHDGVLHTVDLANLTVPRCAECGELVFDDQANEQISQALRRQLRLLTPEQIRTNRLALGLDAAQLSVQLGMPAETIEHLEEGLRIQSRALDNLLRLYFALPQARAAFATAGQQPDFGVVATTAV